MLTRTAASSSSRGLSALIAAAPLPRPAPSPSLLRRAFSATTPSSAPARPSASSSSASLPPPLPHHAHPSCLDPQPLPTLPSSSSSSTSSAPEPSALSLLASQPSHYIVALFMNRRYLLAPGDILTVPRLKEIPVGATLALTRILEVGSRDYTLRAAQPASHPAARVASAKSAHLVANRSNPENTLLRPPLSRSVTVDGTPRDWQRHPDSLPHLGPEWVQADLTVLEHTKGTMFEVDKFKRRKGYRRTLRSKLGFTRLRVGEIRLGPPQAQA